MTSRAAHLVGSLPGSSAYEAMSTAMRVLDGRVGSLPDGETGERRNWVISIIEELRRSHPDLEETKAGDWSDYDKTPVLRVRRGRRLYGANLDFGHISAARDSWPAFEQVRQEFGRPDLPYQSGVPGDLDLAMFTLGPVGALANRRAFTEATLTEIRGVRALAGPDTVFQIEVPVELTLLAKAPTRAMPVLAGRLAAGMANLVRAAPTGSRFGIHLCLGDMNNRAFGTMRDVAPLVALANALVRRWPAEQTLAYVHAPFAAADHPATTDPAFYTPLTGLRLPQPTRFAAGFAHESQTLADQIGIRSMIEDHLQRPVDISAACGLGRRSAEDGRRVLERTAELLDD
jgi:hypothetical protein